MTSLAVDKKRKKVTVSLGDQTQLSGYLFLSHFSGRKAGRQTVLEALTVEGSFVPFETSDGEISFLNQKHIVWVASLINDDDSETELLDNKNVTVFLRDGKRLRGDLYFSMPIEKNRLSDWLNDTRKFLVLRDEKREVLINLDFVIRVT